MIRYRQRDAPRWRSLCFALTERLSVTIYMIDSGVGGGYDWRSNPQSTLVGRVFIIYRPDGEQFLGFIELDQRRKMAEEQRQIAEEQLEIANEQRQIAEERASELAAKLRELGVDPDSPS